jgi:GH15 family glucan-1,4-alpha-glucosidase
MSAAKHVGDYALIGDLQTAALVHRNGSIDWFCAPRFDSDASFAALVGDAGNGFWRIAPIDEGAHVARRYRGNTLVLETTFTTAAGSIQLIDFMAPGATQRTIVRIVEGLSGSLTCHMMLAPRMKYGLIAPTSRREGDAWTARVAPDGLCLRTPVVCHDTEGQTSATLRVHAGERFPFVLQAFNAHEAPPPPTDAAAAEQDIMAWWTAWVEQFKYAGEWREAVLRSAITLKALSYEPAGSFVAAPTTSLPEQLGGAKNWDYRYCWLRDASFTVESLLRVGFRDEARRWRDWFATVCVAQPEFLHIMYGVEGERLTNEAQADWLGGFADSQPVRIANAAHTQFQLGVFGDLLMCFEAAQRAGVTFDAAHWRNLEAVMRHIERVWQRPGNGVWETRDGGRQYVDSKVMAWAGIDRGIALARNGGFPTDLIHWRALAARMHAEICRAGYDAHRNTFTQYYGSVELDASLLLMPIVGFLPADDPRIVGTVAAIERELVADSHVYRYSADSVHESGDGVPNEGAFTMCGFWLARVYALLGRDAEARALFERLLATRNDVGLLSEEFDVARGIAVGNMPQAFSHVGLIDAAHALCAPVSAESLSLETGA